MSSGSGSLTRTTSRVGATGPPKKTRPESPCTSSSSGETWPGFDPGRAVDDDADGAIVVMPNQEYDGFAEIRVGQPSPRLPATRRCRGVCACTARPSSNPTVATSGVAMDRIPRTIVASVGPGVGAVACGFAIGGISASYRFRGDIDESTGARCPRRARLQDAGRVGAPRGDVVIVAAQPGNLARLSRTGRGGDGGIRGRARQARARSHQCARPRSSASCESLVRRPRSARERYMARLSDRRCLDSRSRRRVRRSRWRFRPAARARFRSTTPGAASIRRTISTAGLLGGWRTRAACRAGRPVSCSRAVRSTSTARVRY